MELLGGLRTRRGDEEVLTEFPTRRTASLLAYLAYHRNRRYARDEIVALLWPDVDPTAARGRLTQALVWLRRHLEPADVARGSILYADRLRIGLEPTAFATDVEEFESYLEAARRTDITEERGTALSAAITLYRGDLLPAEYADWVSGERRRLLNSYLTALHDLATIYAQEGDAENALEVARHAVTADPLREESHHFLIRLLAATGHTTEALRQLRELRRLLAAELGTEPSASVAALEALIRQGTFPSPASGERVGAALPATDTRQSILLIPPLRGDPLPAPLTLIFGRESERNHIVRLIGSRRARLVTLTGIAGSGKTRLALAAAAELSAHHGTFAGAVAFVPLTDIDNPALAPAAIAAAIGLTANDPPLPPALLLPQLAQELSAAGPFLLVLDNAEHLADGLAPLLHDLLERTSLLSILVTSRRRFNVEGESEIVVAPLMAPPTSTPFEEIAASPAVRLFADRATAVQPAFAITPENADTVATICARLDGIPLAIELCAAWAQTLTPAEMLERLDRRLDLLVSRRADMPDRHRSLRAALKSSHTQLPAHLQRLFPRLSVFCGGWSLEAAASVSYGGMTDALEVLTHLTDLREHSLVLAEEQIDNTRGPRQTRYRLLGMVREYGAGLLSPQSRATLRRSHAAYFLALAEQAEGELQGADPERWMVAVECELGNLRAALSWSIQTRQMETGLRLAGSLGRYWAAQGPLYEGERWLRLLLSSDGTTSAVSNPIKAKAWGVLGYLSWLQGDYSAARAGHERALELRRAIDDLAGIAESLYHLGITAYRQHDLAAARILLQESLALAEERNDTAGMARVLLNLGNIAFSEQDREQASFFFQRSLALETEVGNRQRVAGTQINLGLLALATGEKAEAGHQIESALSTYRELADRQGISMALAALGTLARLSREMVRARAHLVEGIRIAGNLGDRFALFHQILQLGMVEIADGAPALGVFFVAAAYRLFEQWVGPEIIDEPAEYRDALVAARSALGAAAFEAAQSEGRHAPLDAVVRAALEQK